MVALIKRFALPVLLLAGCVACWIWAQQLGGTNEASASAREPIAADVPILSVRRLPESVVAAHQADQFEDLLGQGTDALTTESCAVILVDGVPIYELRADLALVPGYAQLLYTGLAAIETLGADHQFLTQVLAVPESIQEGRIAGDLYLVGGGDPVLMTERYAQGFRPAMSLRTPVEALADSVVAMEVVDVDGAVIGVDNRYDNEWLPAGVPQGLVDRGLVTPTLGLQIDDGLVERASSADRPARPAEDPVVFAAQSFDRLLEQRNIRVGGLAYAHDQTQDLPQLVAVAAQSSPPLRDIVTQMFAVNDASAANMLTKEIGLARDGAGTTAVGARATTAILESLAGERDVQVRDGSGVAASNRSTCTDLVEIADRLDETGPVASTLPSIGLPGVFGGRLSDLQMDVDVRAIGGTATNMSSLVGRTIDHSPRVTFATIVNRPDGPLAPDLVFQRQVVEAVAVILDEVSPGDLEAVGS